MFCIWTTPIALILSDMWDYFFKNVGNLIH